jgi:hypothetical protein
MDIGDHIARFFPPSQERDMLSSTDIQNRCAEYGWALNSREMAGP